MAPWRWYLALVLGLELPAALAQSSSGSADATTSATTAQGTFTIRGITGHAIHTHGGPPAQLGHARFLFENRGATSRRVSVRDIEFLRNTKGCGHAPDQVVSHPRPAGLLLEDGKQRQSAAQVEVKPGASVNALVGFVPVPAYQVHCDRFAFRVHFQIDGERVAVVDEIEVTREEPLRRGQ